MNHVDTKIAGSRKAAFVTLSALPLIEEHIRPFDGKRVRLKSGDKQFKFREAVDNLVQALRRADGVDNSLSCYVRFTMTSVWLELKVHVPAVGHGVEYFKNEIFLGDIDDSGCLQYRLDAADHREKAETILSLDADDIGKAKQQIADLSSQIEGIRKSLPYCYRELISDYRTGR